MAPTNVIVLSSVTLPIGVTSFGPITPPIGLTSIQIAVDRTLLTSITLKINWSIELSRDSGATWKSWGGAGAVGGALLDSLSNPITESSFTVNFDSLTDVATRVRGSITSNEIVITSVTVRMT